MDDGQADGMKCGGREAKSEKERGEKPTWRHVKCTSFTSVKPDLLWNAPDVGRMIERLSDDLTSLQMSVVMLSVHISMRRKGTICGQKSWTGSDNGSTSGG